MCRWTDHHHRCFTGACVLMADNYTFLVSTSGCAHRLDKDPYHRCFTGACVLMADNYTFFLIFKCADTQDSKSFSRFN
jgi:hypothetical protein